MTAPSSVSLYGRNFSSVLLCVTASADRGLLEVVSAMAILEIWILLQEEY